MKSYRRMGVILGLVACAALGAQAQDAATPVASNAAQMTWGEIWEYGGWLMYVIGALSVFAVANVLVLFFTLRTGAVVPRSLVRDVVAKVRDGALPEARAQCEDRPSPFSAVAMVAIDYVRTSPEADAAMVKDMVTGEGVRQVTKLQGSTQWLVDIAAVAPMCGLLGTVIGMLIAFGAVAGDVAAAKPVLLALGVSRALITTIAGLLVAIPSQLFYAWFRRCASRLTAQLETASQELLTAILLQRTR